MRRRDRYDEPRGGREYPRDERLREENFAGAGGYAPTTWHSDYGFQGSEGAYGDYGGADRFTGDYRGDAAPWMPRQQRAGSDRSWRGDSGERRSRREDSGKRDWGSRERDWEPGARDWEPGARDWESAGSMRGRTSDEPMVVYSEVWTISGPYAGRGPLGYRRSDDRIREDVCEILSRHGDLDASDIEVRVQGGTVELHGNVDDRRDKYLAEDLAESIPGVTDVTSRLRVRKSSRSESYEKKFREERAELDEERDRNIGRA
jgi:hypothetical protein